MAGKKAYCQAMFVPHLRASGNPATHGYSESVTFGLNRSKHGLRRHWLMSKDDRQYDWSVNLFWACVGIKLEKEVAILFCSLRGFMC